MAVRATARALLGIDLRFATDGPAKEDTMRRTSEHHAVPIVVLCLALALSSCAALTNPHPQSIPVTSTPEGADVLIDGTLVGRTPLTLQLDGRYDYHIVVRSNRQERRFTLESRVDGGYAALDVLPGATFAALGLVTSIEGYGVIGTPGIVAGAGAAALAVTIDATSGQWLRLAPNRIHVTFE